MKPFLHAKASVKRYGGVPEDYIEVHEFLDESKAHHADMRHRALLHNSFGCYLAARLFGDKNGNITISTGKQVSVRDLCEEHIIEDMGRIPAVTEYFQGMPFYDWLGGPKRKVTRYAMKTGANIED